MKELQEALKREKTCAVIVLPAHGGNSTVTGSNAQPFRNEATLKLGSELASCLSSAGYNVSPARPGKSSEAFFQVVQPSWKINVVLHSEASLQGPIYRLLLWPTVPVLGRLRGSIDVVGIKGSLAEVLTQITGHIRATHAPVTVSLMTREELERSTMAIS